MAVQKSKKSRSKIKMRRSHTNIKSPVLSIDNFSGEMHLRHYITNNGYYKGKKLIDFKNKK